MIVFRGCMSAKPHPHINFQLLQSLLDALLLPLGYCDVLRWVQQPILSSCHGSLGAILEHHDPKKKIRSIASQPRSKSCFQGKCLASMCHLMWFFGGWLQLVEQDLVGIPPIHLLAIAT